MVKPPFRCPVPVRWGDVDACGVVNNAAYLSYVEQARWLYFGELGLLEGGRFPFVLGETTARYRKSATAHSRLEVEARTVRLGGASFDMESSILDGDELLVQVKATLVTVDASGASQPMSEVFRRRVAAFEGIPERSPA